MTDSYLLGSTIRAFSGHEFRTPMSAILGLARIIHESAGQISVAEQQELTNHILESAQYLMNSSLRLSTWYELKNNQIGNKGHFNLTTEQILQMIKEEADQQLSNGAFFSFSSETQTLKISGNEKILIMAMKELINNSFKFAKKNTINTFSISDVGAFYKISMSNISDKVNSFDFDKYIVFTQFDRQYFEQQGLGLGLAIAQLGIKLCQGQLDIRTEAIDEKTSKVVCEIQLPITQFDKNF